MAKITINTEICTNCNLCVEVCPRRIFTNTNSNCPEIIQEETCIECAHCIAVCPVNAVIYPEIKNVELKELYFKAQSDIVPFLSSLRSVRNFKQKEVGDEIINELIKISSLAPAASNNRNVKIEAIKDNFTIERLEASVMAFFKTMSRIFNPMVCYLLYIFNRALYTYAKNIVPTLIGHINNFKKGEKPVFRNAPCVIIFHAPLKNRMSKDNCDACLHYFRLAAHSFGLGTCIIGYGISAHKNLERALKIDKNHKVFGVLTLGYPKYKYSKSIIRKPY